MGARSLPGLLLIPIEGDDNLVSRIGIMDVGALRCIIGGTWWRRMRCGFNMSSRGVRETIRRRVNNNVNIVFVLLDDVWDSSADAVLSTLEGHSQWVFSVSWSPDGRKFASGSSDKK
jgi:hypothetical protein